jgi:hypothetical protein
MMRGDFPLSPPKLLEFQMFGALFALLMFVVVPALAVPFGRDSRDAKQRGQWPGASR